MITGEECLRMTSCDALASRSRHVEETIRSELHLKYDGLRKELHESARKDIFADIVVNQFEREKENLDKSCNLLFKRLGPAILDLDSAGSQRLVGFSDVYLCTPYPYSRFPYRAALHALFSAVRGIYPEMTAPEHQGTEKQRQHVSNITNREANAMLQNPEVKRQLFRQLGLVDVGYPQLSDHLLCIPAQDARRQSYGGAILVGPATNSDFKDFFRALAIWRDVSYVEYPTCEGAWARTVMPDVLFKYGDGTSLWKAF